MWKRKRDVRRDRHTHTHARAQTTRKCDKRCSTCRTCVVVFSVVVPQSVSGVVSWLCRKRLHRSARGYDGQVGAVLEVFFLFCLFVGCLTSQQHVSVSQGRIYLDNFACCHIEIEVAFQTFHLTQSQYTDTGPTSPGADPIMPGARQGSHWSASF